MRRRTALAAGGIVLALGASACTTNFGMPRGATTQGQSIDTLWRIFVGAAAFVGAVVYGLIAWSIVRYRRRRTDAEDAEGASFRNHIPIEIVYTGIPILMIAGLFAASWRTGNEVGAISKDPSVLVRAEAFAWGWRFTYPSAGVEVVSAPSGEGVPGPTIELPLGETTQFELTSDDVIHAFWVPGFLFKRDAIPGHVSVFDVTPTRTGTFLGECAEFCGLNHAYMTFTVKVVPPAEFRAWLASAPRATPSPSPSAPAPTRSPSPSPSAVGTSP